MIHDIRAAAIGAQRQAAADDLAERREVGRDAEKLLRPAVGQPEAGHHLVEDEQCAMLRREPTSRLQKLPRGHDEPHVAHHRLEQNRRDRVALRRECPLERLGLVVFEHERVLRGAGGDAGGVWHAERRGRRAGGHEQAVDVAVVIARELDQLVAASEPAGETHGAHRRLGAAAHHPHLLDARHGRDDQFSKPALGLGGRAVARARGECPFDCGDHSRVAVAEDHRAPGADVVEIRVAVDVGEVLPRGALEEDRLAADAAEGAGR